MATGLAISCEVLRPWQKLTLPIRSATRHCVLGSGGARILLANLDFDIHPRSIFVVKPGLVCEISNMSGVKETVVYIITIDTE